MEGQPREIATCFGRRIVCVHGLWLFAANDPARRTKEGFLASCKESEARSRVMLLHEMVQG
jgi:hypothetical protein